MTVFYEDYQDGTGFSDHEDYQAKRVCMRTKDVVPGKNWITNKDYQDRTGFRLVKSRGTYKDEKRPEIYQGTDNFVRETRKMSLAYVMMHVRNFLWHNAPCKMGMLHNFYGCDVMMHDFV